MSRLAVWCAAAASLSWNPALATDVPLKLGVRSSFPEPAYVNSQSLSAVRRIAGNPEANGLTHAEFHADFKALYELRNSRGEWCVTAISADYTIRYEKVTVYIPSEFPRGSCRYQAILEHEQKHVRESREVLNRLSPRVEGMVSETVRQSRSNLCGSSEDAARKAASALLQQGLNRIVTRQKEIQTQLQSAIDTPDEYRRVALSCPLRESPR